MSNQDLIDQVNADKTRITGLIADRNSAIENNNLAIASYNSNIEFLTNLTATYEADIQNFNTQINNDNLIIGFIPPDGTK